MSDTTPLQSDSVAIDCEVAVVCPQNAPQDTPQQTTQNADPKQADQPVRAAGRPKDPLARLPEYTRSLLKIQVPLIVRLASKKQSIGEIVQLGPSSIVKFDKSCEEMLELSVGQCPIAVGEAVKVGDKFGLRITSLIRPSERFCTVKLVAQSDDQPQCDPHVESEPV